MNLTMEKKQSARGQDIPLREQGIPEFTAFEVIKGKIFAFL